MGAITVLTLAVALLMSEADIAAMAEAAMAAGVSVLLTSEATAVVRGVILALLFASKVGTKA